MKFKAALQSLQTYEAGKPIELVVREFGISANEVIKLASNENPHGCSKKVQQCVAQKLASMHLYPDDSFYQLKEALGAKHKVDTSQIIIGAGSDQIIEFAIHAKCAKNDGILMAGVTFAMYEIYGRIAEAKIIRTKSSTHNLSEFTELYKQHSPSIIFLCVPNNPLGESLKVSDIQTFLKQINKECLVVIDGAYQEYATFKDEEMRISVAEFIRDFPNVLYLGTFSKVYGLGGMRVGYGIAQQEIIQTLYKLRPPFNITTLSLVAAIEALKDEEFIKYSLQDCFTQMKQYEDFCRQRGIRYIPSFANFITLFLDGLGDSTTLAQKMLEKGVIIRNLASYGLNAVRITIGTKEQNQRALSLMSALL
ncbi:histidinol-phosphate transaminase [Helicobacter monodelphidis]|uniref:histidinol-phosphate transaminase n=1 Tax=Helicobacter sp. 15-1451 TaxID=2004995 RepID=UPI000DCCDD6B|nr:histidinol-phosphate transaminase [Helicobacter sp. 15-1451]RAX57439.1 histidinol-phosphate transaminase [Helicobacter sp. 15-1451]